MDLNEIQVFDGKNLSDLFKEIYDNSVEKRKKMLLLVDDLRKLITNPADSMMLIPAIKEFMEVAVKNDENLIKLTAIIQRILVSSNNSDTGELISEKEKEQLIKGAEEAYLSIKSSLENDYEVTNINNTGSI